MPVPTVVREHVRRRLREVVSRTRPTRTVSDMTGVVVSGVVIFAVVVLAAVALFLAAVVLDKRGAAVERQAHFLDGLRRISSRVRE